MSIKYDSIRRKTEERLRAAYPDGVRPDQYAALIEMVLDLHRECYFEELDATPEVPVMPDVVFEHDPPMCPLCDHEMDDHSLARGGECLRCGCGHATDEPSAEVLKSLHENTGGGTMRPDLQSNVTVQLTWPSGDQQWGVVVKRDGTELQIATGTITRLFYLLPSGDLNAGVRKPVRCDVARPDWRPEPSSALDRDAQPPSPRQEYDIEIVRGIAQMYENQDSYRGTRMAGPLQDRVAISIAKEDVLDAVAERLGLVESLDVDEHVADMISDLDETHARVRAAVELLRTTERLLLRPKESNT